MNYIQQAYKGNNQWYHWIFTLILVVPIWLAALHQIGAFFLLTATTYSLFIFSKS